MKRIIIFLFYFIVNYCYGQLSQAQLLIGGDKGGEARSTIQTTDSGYAIAGWAGTFGPLNMDFHVVKMDKNGNLLWTRTFGGDKSDLGQAIVQTYDGGYAVGGYSSSFPFGVGDNTNVYVVKLDVNGNIEWTRTVGGMGQDQGWSLIQTADSGYAIGGFTNSFGEGGYDCYMVKLDKTGALEWTKTVGGPADDRAFSVFQTKDAGFVLGGGTFSYGDGDEDLYVVKLDPAGNLEWTRTVGGFDTEAAYSIMETKDGCYVAAGLTYSFANAGSGKDIYLIKLSSSGALIWTRTLGGPLAEWGRSVIETADSNYVTAGRVQSYGAGSYDLDVAKWDTSGTLLWETTAGTFADDVFYGSVTQTYDGGYAATGITSAFSFPSSDYYFVKFDAAGITCNSGSGGFVGTGGVPGQGGVASAGGVSGSGGSIRTYDCVVKVICPFLITSTIDDVICNGDCNGQLTANTGGGNPPYIFLWSNGATTQTITGLCPGTFTITVTDNFGTSLTATVTVAEPSAIGIVDMHTDVCLGNVNGTATINVTGGTPAYSYLWNTLLNATTTSVSGLADGTYSVIVTDIKGCSSVANVTISALPLPVVIITGDTAVCIGHSALLTASGGNSYSWNTGDATSAISITPTSTGTYTVIVTDGNGCSSISTVTISVLSLPVAVISKDTSICNGNAVTISASGGNSYSWNTGDLIPSINISPTSTSTYTVIVTDSNGCTNDTAVTITVVQVPVVNLGPDEFICVGEEIVLNGSGLGRYVWNTGATTTSISVIPTSDTIYTLTVSNVSCDETDSITVLVNTNPIANAGSDTIIEGGGSVMLNGSGGGTYSWSPSDGLSCIDCPNPVASPESTTIYYLTVTNANGCISIDTVIVEVTCGELFVPNAFSPNDDDENDVLYVLGNCLEKYEFRIYNRWGEIVFQSTDISEGWNGWDVKSINTDVFAYILNSKITGKEPVTKTGNVYLIR